MGYYSDRFWKKNWDEGIDDLRDEEYNTTYVDMVAESFRTYPEKIALNYLGVSITYSDMDKYTNQFANMLIEQGFKKGDVVGINLPNTPQYLISLVGALKAGCIISGVSPLLSAEQIKYQINDLTSTGKKAALVTLDAIFEGHIVKIAADMPGLDLIIATNPTSFLPKIKQILGKLLKKVPTGKVTPIAGKTVMELHKDVLAKASANPVDVEVTPDDLGWIQYTGGTTGPPKGAALSHRNVAHNIVAINRWLGWDQGDGVLLSGFPMFHIAGLTVCESALCLGWTQVLIPNPRDTDNICKEIETHKPTYLVNVPSLYQMLMANPKFKELDLSTIKGCVSAASPFPKESQMEFEKIVGQGKLLELYGMTETSPVSTMNPSKKAKKLGTVGMPICNVDITMLNPETGEEVPVGEPGEICIKGPLVMQGYFNRPDATKSTVDEDGFLHTGDVGIMDEDGFIKIVDRTKDMIIVGGFKVFSSKVEDVISQHPAIGLLALVGKPNPARPGSEVVRAYIQLDPVFKFDGNYDALKEDIIAFAKDKVSPYEVPKEVEFMAEIPLTTVGKVDKKVLRKQ
jgi:long-chain acyl-CoA synthetase